jgi:hypothetical protein
MDRQTRVVPEEAFRPLPEEPPTREEVEAYVLERPSRKKPPFGPKPGRETPGGWRR